MSRILLVMAGGALGSGARYALSSAVQARTGTLFPSGTFAVNLIGCVIFGVVVGLATRPSVIGDDARVFLLAGICGGFTTFSSFGFDTVELIRAGQPALAAANVALQVVLGAGGLWAGMTLARATS
jgi:CrcB protein